VVFTTQLQDLSGFSGKPTPFRSLGKKLPANGAFQQLLEHPRKLGIMQQVASGVPISICPELLSSAGIYRAKRTHIQWLHFVF
jgi:hypothetical protein